MPSITSTRSVFHHHQPMRHTHTHMRHTHTHAHTHSYTHARTHTHTHAPQFLSAEEKIQHVAWDMARCNKREGTVLQNLDKFGSKFVQVGPSSITLPSSATACTQASHCTQAHTPARGLNSSPARTSAICFLGGRGRRWQIGRSSGSSTQSRSSTATATTHTTAQTAGA